VRPKIVRFAGESLKAQKPLKTDEIFQVIRNQKLNRRSNRNHLINCGEETGLLDQRLVNRGITEENNGSHPLDRGTEDQQLLDLDGGA